MATVICVLRSGGIYNAEWVRKLRDGVARHGDARFVCLSDTEVPCERIPLEHDWPGWWAKIELFRPGVITGPTLYLDLDTVITGDLSEFLDLPHDFAMLRNFNYPEMVGSGVMWLKTVPNVVYERFKRSPQQAIDYHVQAKNEAYIGDQAFIYDSLDRDVKQIHSPALRSYKKHCRGGLPKGTSIVCFHGKPRPTEVNHPWMKEHWK